MLLFPKTYPREGNDENLFPKTYPEDCKDDEAVPENSKKAE